MKFFITKAFLAAMTLGRSSSALTRQGRGGSYDEQDEESFWSGILAQELDSMEMPTSKPSASPTNPPTIEEVAPTPAPTNHPTIEEVAPTSAPSNHPTIEVVSTPPTNPADPNTLPPSGSACISIENTICSVPEFSTLCTLIDIAGLGDALNGDIFTIFTPTNDAFDLLPPEILLSDDDAFLRDILLYHTIPEVEVLAEDLICGGTVMMGNQEDTTSVCADDVIFQVGAGNAADALPQIIGQNAKACNGIIHAVNQVILPDLTDSNATFYPSGTPTTYITDSNATSYPSDAPTTSLNPTPFPSDITFPDSNPTPFPSDITDSNPTSFPSDITDSNATSYPSDTSTTTQTPTRSCQSLAEAICSLPEFEILCLLVGNASLTEALNGDDKLTIFAPINSAFTELPLDLASEVTSDVEFLTTVLLSHAVAGELFSKGIGCDSEVLMLSGEKAATICFAGHIYLRGGGNSLDSLPELIAPDGIACNGVIHAISQVILPDMTETTVPEPTDFPSALDPTAEPTGLSSPTDSPSVRDPTAEPTGLSSPTDGPTVSSPTYEPSALDPTAEPSVSSPSDGPSALDPTAEPTVSPPTYGPSALDPTAEPTGLSSPTDGPSALDPTAEPTGLSSPTDLPSALDPTAEPTCQYLTEVICFLPEFQILCSLVERADVTTAMGDLVQAADIDGQLTIFAPINDAFAALSLDVDAADRVFLGKVLLSHVTQGELFSADLECGGEISMLSGEKTTTVCVGDQIFQRGGGNTLDSLPEVVAPDGTGCNGVIHAINQVILPEATDSPSSAPSGLSDAVDAVLFAFVRNALSQFFLHDGTEIEDTDSYQSRALRKIASYDGVVDLTNEQLVQYYVLYCIYFATNRVTDASAGVFMEWEDEGGWGDEDVEPCNGWFGISCDEEGRIQNFDMPNNQMAGTFPPEIKLLANDGQYATGAGRLERLDLTDNRQLENGNDSSWISDLGFHMETISLENTRFGGPFPRLPSGLVNFDVSGAFFTGLEDSKLEGVEFLNYLDLTDNKFDGTVPSVLNRLPHLEFLYLSGNSFTGDLGFMNGMPSMRELWIDRNDELTGPLFDFIGDMSTLESFSVSSSKLTGTIPESLGNLSIMKQMWLTSNSLTGSVPSSLGNLPMLIILELQGNMLTGSMPEEVCETPLFKLGADCHGEDQFVCACCTCCGVAACDESVVVDRRLRK